MSAGNYTVKVYPILDLKKLRDQLNGIGTDTKQGKQIGKNMGKPIGDSMADNMVRAFKRKVSYGLLNAVSTATKSAVKGMVANTIDLDKSQVELSKVTELSGKSMEEFTDKAFEAGRMVAKTGKEMIDASTEFSKSGFGDDPKMALNLAKIATMYQNIADEEISAGDASNFIVSQLKVFGSELSEVYGDAEGQATHVVDAVNEVANTFAVSSGDIAGNLGKASAAAHNAGMSYEQLIGVMTGMTEINRNAGKSARANYCLYVQ